MTIRDEYEYLKTELMVRLTDTTTMCNLDFPFDLKISTEEEDKYFLRGTKARLATKKSMIILENTYKKIHLFPSKEMAQTFVETRDDILKDWKKDVLDAFMEEDWRFNKVTIEAYEQYIDSLAVKIKQASAPYVKLLSTLTQADIEREIEAKDKLYKTENQTVLRKSEKDDNGSGLF